MREFVKTLYRDIADAQRAMALAQQVGHPYEAYLHCARLQNLLDTARRNGVAAHGWVDPSVRPVLAENMSGAED